MQNVAIQIVGCSRAPEKKAHLSRAFIEGALCLGIAVVVNAVIGAIWFLSLLIV
jgi:hypothetical protein